MVLSKVKKFTTDECKHNSIVMDSKVAMVRCGLCGEQLNPLWVLEQLCDKEASARQELDRLKRQIEITKNKTRCKCQKCGEMTGILNHSEINKAYYG